MMQSPTRPLISALFLLFAIICIGTVGYVVIEGWSLIDSLYMVIITITTTGFKEVHPLSKGGELFTILLLASSFAVVLYVAGVGIQILIESKIFKRKRMENRIRKLENHYIVCGYGRMGTHICEELLHAGADFVVVENNSANHPKLDAAGYLYDTGDASQDETLERVGIKKAKGLVAVLPTDPENVFTTLTAKYLNPKIFVVARAIEEETVPKLKKAGADRVINPYELGGVRMASLLLRPGVADFIEIVSANKNIDLQIEEFVVKKGSKMHKKKLSELPIRTEFNAIVVSVQDNEKGAFVYNPKGDAVIEEGYTLIVIGEPKNLEKLKDY